MLMSARDRDSATRAGCDVLIISAWFPPEHGPFGQMMFELARYLGEKGLRVEVITCVPSQTAGHVLHGFRNRLYQEQRSVQNVRVRRVGILPRRCRVDRPPGRLYRMAAFAWFTFAASVAAILGSQPKAMFAVLQPLILAVPLLAIGRLRRSKVVFNVQDLHPDALINVGLIRSPVVIAALRRMERTAYRKADRIVVICNDFRDHCVERGADPSRIAVIPNWIDLDEIRPQALPSPLRGALGIEGASFVALYAGTIGLVSGAEVLLEAVAGLPKDAGVHVVFVGEGQLVPRLKAEVVERGLACVHFLSFQPRERLNDVQALGDVSMVTLLPGHGRTSVPSKVLGYMAAGRAIIAAVDADSETAKFIRSAGAGWVVSPGDPAGLREALCRVRDDTDERRRRGERGRRYLVEHHSQAGILASYADLLRGVGA